MKIPVHGKHILLIGFLATLAACQSAGGTGLPAGSVATLTPTGTAKPPRHLTICMGQEPASLYLYAGSGLAMHTVLESVYDGPIDSVNFTYQPIILQQIPSFENGGATLQPVTVKQGDMIINDDGILAPLENGVRYRPSGCKDSSCVAAYAGGKVKLDQLAVTFHFKPGVLWSDGQPLTADDSVYSYELASSKETPVPVGMKTAVQGTQKYEAVDAQTVRWTGLPGNMDSGYARRFWSPLPRHAWSSLKAADLLKADLSARTPLGWGPYVIDSWTAGKSIELHRNPHYFRAEEGLPKFDTLSIRFIDPSGELGTSALLSGECDIVDQTVNLNDQLTMLLDLQKRSLVQLDYSVGTAWEHIDFNLQPASGYGKKYLQDVRLRQAFAYCTPRQKIAETQFAGLSVVPDTYLPPQHPLAAKDAAKYPYDPAKGKALLDQIGWKDEDGDLKTSRTAKGVLGVTEGTPLRMSLAVLDTVSRRQMLSVLDEGMTACGIGLDITFQDTTMFVTVQDGLLFGRRFDLAQFSFLTGIEPPCEIYTTAEIPTHENGWAGWNLTGFSNPEYDKACSLARRSLPGTPEYTQNQQLAQKIFADNLPSLPLFLTVMMAAARPDVSGLIVDPTAVSALWNLEQFDIQGTR
jgi:peptide/nickel transport system substrate-binding protein